MANTTNDLTESSSDIVFREDEQTETIFNGRANDNAYDQERLYENTQTSLLSRAL